MEENIQDLLADHIPSLLTENVISQLNYFSEIVKGIPSQDLRELEKNTFLNNKKRLSEQEIINYELNRVIDNMSSIKPDFSQKQYKDIKELIKCVMNLMVQTKNSEAKLLLDFLDIVIGQKPIFATQFEFLNTYKQYYKEDNHGLYRTM